MSKRLLKYSEEMSHTLRRTLRIFIPTAVLILLLAVVFFWFETDKQHSGVAADQQNALLVSSHSISLSLKEVGDDLLYLVGRTRTASHDAINSPQLIDAIARDWMVFSKAKAMYNKIRWIGEDGKEILRIDYTDKRGVFRVNEQELQEKGHRYFVQKALGLKRGELFISPMDLNMDQGRIEIPRHPNIRLAMGLFDNYGHRHGVLIINYSTRFLLESYKKMSGERYQQLHWLVNKDGYWLKGSTEEDEFAFMFDDTESTMAHRYPDAWKIIRNNTSGQFTTADGLWTFETVYPLNDWQGDNTDSYGNHLYRRISDESKYCWKAIFLLPTSEYHEGLGFLLLQLCTAYAVCLIIVFWASWRYCSMIESGDRIRNELGFATDIQNNVLPNLKSPEITDRKEFTIYAEMSPAKEVGGDFYDVFFVDDTHLCFIIADVSDKGVPAALYMMLAKTLLKAEMRRYKTPAEALESVNQALATENESCMFVTVLCCVLNTQTGIVTISNGGHNPPLIVRSGEVDFVKLKKGFVIGPMSDVKFRSQEIQLHPSDTLLLYTDGVTDAEDESLRQYGEERLKASLQRIRSLNPETIVTCIKHDVDTFADGNRQTDDITILALTYHGAQKKHGHHHKKHDPDKASGDHAHPRED